MERLTSSSTRFRAAAYHSPEILDAAVWVIMEYVRSGMMFYREEAVADSISGTYTLFEEAGEREAFLILGGFS